MAKAFDTFAHDPSQPAGTDMTPDDLRQLAATKFDGITVDPSAFAAETWARRSFDLGCLNRLVHAVLGKDDLELARGIHEDTIAEATTEMLEKFQETAEYYRSAAEAFDAGQARLMVALTRYAYHLDRDGNPQPSN
jgi:hypothetical protein